MSQGNPFDLQCDPATGLVRSLKLYGAELLAPEQAAGAELMLNGLPFPMRVSPRPGQPAQPLQSEVRLRGERFVNHFTGAGLTMSRIIGTRPKLPFNAVGVAYYLSREQAELSYYCPGPGGPVMEAPMYVDTLTLLNWNWKFWGEDTRMIYPHSYSAGPCGENEHIGYEHSTPEEGKRFLGHVFRRQYPGGLVLHGAAFYNARTGQWIAITCRRPNLSYIVNIRDAGRGVCFDFTFHALLPLGTILRLPEITFYYGETREEMMRWMAEYATFYYREPPAWTHKTLWGPGIAWNNEATWTQQADLWERELDKGQYNGIWINLVTERPMVCGTSPTGYRPDPRHGTLDEFRAMCRRIADRGVPLVTWFSHSGFLPGGPEIDDDWFQCGADGRWLGAWGSGDAASMLYVNPGHPGYRAYTKKWIEFYIKECGVKGIFLDCLGFPFPPDFKPRAFQRFPGETPVLAISFMEEMYAFIKSCDPEAVMIGEGTSLDGPVEIFSIVTNPRRGLDGFGPRDYLLNLGRHGRKRMSIYSEVTYLPAAGHCVADLRPAWAEHNRYLMRLLKEKGGPGRFTWVPVDLSAVDDLLIVPTYQGSPDDYRREEIRLPAPWDGVKALREEIRGDRIARAADGAFRQVTPGFYRMT